MPHKFERPFYLIDAASMCLRRAKRDDREVFEYTMVLLYDTQPKPVSMRYKPHDWEVILRMQNELIEAYEQTYPNHTLKIVFSGLYLVRFIPIPKPTNTK